MSDRANTLAAKFEEFGNELTAVFNLVSGKPDHQQISEASDRAVALKNDVVASAKGNKDFWDSLPTEVDVIDGQRVQRRVIDMFIDRLRSVENKLTWSIQYPKQLSAVPNPYADAFRIHQRVLKLIRRN